MRANRRQDFIFASSRQKNSRSKHSVCSIIHRFPGRSPPGMSGSLTQNWIRSAMVLRSPRVSGIGAGGQPSYRQSSRPADCSGRPVQHGSLRLSSRIRARESGCGRRGQPRIFAPFGTVFRQFPKLPMHSLISALTGMWVDACPLHTRCSGRNRFRMRMSRTGSPVRHQFIWARTTPG